MRTITEQGQGAPSVRRPKNPLKRIFWPQEPIPRALYVGAGVTVVALALLAWCVLTYGGLVSALFLPSPTKTLQSFGRLLANGSLLRHAQASLTVVLVGWLLAAALAVPLGILMGSFRIAEAVLEPLVNFVRYLPVSALIPLLILYVGIDIKSRIAVIFIGTFFQLILLVADVASHVPIDLLHSAYTLGAKPRNVVTRVLIPATLPGVMDSLRITMGWAWTYLVVAELVAADRGLGYMIMDSMRGLFVDRIFVGLVVIGLLGFLSDQLFKWLHRRLLPWSPKL